MRIALFATCLGDQFFAEAVADAVRLLRHLGVEVAFPPEQTCCGQPSHNAGHRAEAVEMARHTVRAFEGYDHVVLPSGSCAAMLRHGYPKLLGDGADTGGAPFGDRARELAEFLVEVLGVDRLGDGLEGRRLAYHHGCHALRELGLETQATTLLEGAGARLVPWEADRECCGFGGLFSVKHPSVSAAMADRKLDTLPASAGTDAGPDAPYALTSADGGCLLHLEGRIRKRGLGIPVRPLASLLWEATGQAADDPGIRREAPGGD